MRIKLLVTGFIASACAITAGVLPSAYAATLPGIEGGDIYRVRNVTKNSAFTDPAAADKCEEVQYRVRIHNPGPDQALNNVTVQATIPSAAATQNVSTVIVRAANASPTTVTDTANVTLPAAYKITYVPGSSQLLDSAGNIIRSIGDVTSGSGVDIGTVGISINERRFVQFSAKVDCPKPPEVEKSYACTSLKAVMIDKNRYKVTATATATNVTIQNYAFTVKKDNNTVDTKTVATSNTTAEYDFNQTGQGTYVINAVVTTDAGATNPVVCAVQITVPKDGDQPQPPVTPTTPGTPASTTTPGSTSVSVLPETGPAGVVGIFAAVTTVSSLIYSVISRKFAL